MTLKTSDCRYGNLIRMRVQAYIERIRYKPSPPKAKPRYYPWDYYWTPGEPRWEFRRPYAAFFE